MKTVDRDMRVKRFLLRAEKFLLEVKNTFSILFLSKANSAITPVL